MSRPRLPHPAPDPPIVSVGRDCFEAAGSNPASQGGTGGGSNHFKASMLLMSAKGIADAFQTEGRTTEMGQEEKAQPPRPSGPLFSS